LTSSQVGVNSKLQIEKADVGQPSWADMDKQGAAAVRSGMWRTAPEQDDRKQSASALSISRNGHGNQHQHSVVRTETGPPPAQADAEIAIASTASAATWTEPFVEQIAAVLGNPSKNASVSCSFSRRQHWSSGTCQKCVGRGLMKYAVYGTPTACRAGLELGCGRRLDDERSRRTHTAAVKTMPMAAAPSAVALRLHRCRPCGTLPNMALSCTGAEA